jgi:hypothetical protein
MPSLSPAIIDRRDPASGDPPSTPSRDDIGRKLSRVIALPDFFDRAAVERKADNLVVKVRHLIPQLEVG